MNWAIFIAALISVESNGNEKAVGDRGKSIGSLQIGMAALNDVNRIYGVGFVPADRWDEKKSIRLAVLYLAHYGRRYEKMTGKPFTAEIAARVWNGGPNGWRKDSTNEYWAKVQLQLRASCDDSDICAPLRL